LREICPRKKRNPKSGANIGAITGILLSLLLSSEKKTKEMDIVCHIVGRLSEISNHTKPD
jgi:hypothetical protein